MKAWRGRCRGTSCPAPLIVTNVRPLQTSLHPPTYIIKPKYIRTETMKFRYGGSLVGKYKLVQSRRKVGQSIGYMSSNQVGTELSTCLATTIQQKIVCVSFKGNQHLHSEESSHFFFPDTYTSLVIPRVPLCHSREFQCIK